MATFNNGESGSSVRTKINEAIDKVDGNTAFDNDIDVNGNVSLGDNDELRLGDSNDLIIEHNGSFGDIFNKTSVLAIRNGADNQDVVIQTDDGSGSVADYFRAEGSTGEAKMYYYGSEKLNTKSTGVDVTGDLTVDTTTLHVDSTNNRVGIGTSAPAVELHIDGSNPQLRFQVVDDTHKSRIEFCDAAGNIDSQIQGGGSLGSEIDVYGSIHVNAPHNMSFADNSELRFGDGNDLIIEHNTSNGDIRNVTNDLLIRNLADDRDVRIISDDGSGGTADYFRADGSTGEAQLFYYGAEKLNTLSNGVYITGAITLAAADPFIKLTDTSTNVDHEIDANSGVGNLVINTDINSEGSDPKLLLKVTGTTGITVRDTGNVDIAGALSKGSGSFKIDHPLKPESHHLVHSFVEAPQADNIYRGKVSLVAGAATVNLDEAGRMTAGTFVLLNGNIQCFTSNEDGWTSIKGSVSGNTLTIQAQDASCTDTVSWLVIGERHDQHMRDTNWTDAAGRVITEPEKQAEEDE
jgi:hypothetical protein